MEEATSERSSTSKHRNTFLRASCSKFTQKLLPCVAFVFRLVPQCALDIARAICGAGCDDHPRPQFPAKPGSLYPGPVCTSPLTELTCMLKLQDDPVNLLDASQSTSPTRLVSSAHPVNMRRGNQKLVADGSILIQICSTSLIRHISQVSLKRVVPKPSHDPFTPLSL